MQKNKTIAICGAGIVGVATAYYLSKNNPDFDIILIDKNQPLSFTTSKSGENFRDYWPQECMARFVGHSIDLMEGLRQLYGADSFEMVYSGYNFISQHKEQIIFPNNNADKHLNTGFEEITDTDIIQNKYPFYDKNIQKLVRIKKAGKMDVYALGSLLFREAKKQGMKYMEGEIMDIHKTGLGFKIMLHSGTEINADKIVIAAGPFINHIANMVGIKFPISNTLQHKFMMPDPKGIIPKNMPFTIVADSQYLEWTAEEAAFFSSQEEYKWLLDKFPAGLHIKPESGGIKFGWAFQRKEELPTWETPGFELFPQVVLKGASRYIPQLAAYENNIPTPLIQYAGYYTRTRENWPLIGPTELQDIYVAGAFAGFGTMAACAAGELCADYILEKKELPFYARYFHPERYKDAVILEEMGKLESDGQL